MTATPEELSVDVADLMEQIEPHLQGKTKAVILLALLNTLAIMMARNDAASREGIITAIPVTLRDMLAQFDRKHANGAAMLRTPPARSF